MANTFDEDDQEPSEPVASDEPLSDQLVDDQQVAIPERVDALIVGAGFAGLYAIHRLRDQGLAVLAIDSADGVGGTWYHNRYPGARCDIPSLDYCYSFDPELETAWQWSEKYATQPEILAYLNFVADRYSLRSEISLATRLTGAAWDEALRSWEAELVRGDQSISIEARFLVLATGGLSAPNDPSIDGLDSFGGELLHTGRWPHEPVDFSGRRVGVIGTGSSGIQSIPIIADQASSLVVFQRTPNFSMPARNGPQYAPTAEGLAADRDAYRDAARQSRVGVPVPVATDNPRHLDGEERNHRFEQIWNEGHLVAPSMHVADLGLDAEANELFAEFIRSKIRETVEDAEVAEKLSPRSHPFGTKRPCLDTDYYATFNRDHVTLVDVNTEPIERVETDGVRTSGGLYELDAIVLATGFDAMTGAVLALDLVGRDQRTLSEHWHAGPETYLGLMSHGFPNAFMITGPGSPSVLSNMAVSIEQHVDWVSQAIDDLGASGCDTIEPTEDAEQAWTQHVDDAAAITLYPLAQSWYRGTNVDAKPTRMLPYVGGVGHYRRLCDRVVAQDYLGFERRGPHLVRRIDGIIAPLQIDVQAVLDAYAKAELPPLNTLTAPDARALDRQTKATRPAGPTVGAECLGSFPGAESPLEYRLYLPDTTELPPLIVYFHGGGWVLGDARSDEPFCRDLCVRSGAAVLSLDYRHGPEHRYPAAVDDAWAGWQWALAHATELGCDDRRIAISGWSAGGNLAAVVSRRSVDTDGVSPPAAQLLVCPVTDGDASWPSSRDYRDGYLLTGELMEWFFDQYCDATDRHSVDVSPLRNHLAGLPSTMVVTAEFDILRDQGESYASNAAEAGCRVVSRRARGHIHTSFHMVDVVRSAEPYRAEMASFLREAFAAAAV